MNQDKTTEQAAEEYALDGRKVADSNMEIYRHEGFIAGAGWRQSVLSATIEEKEMYIGILEGMLKNCKAAIDNLTEGYTEQAATIEEQKAEIERQASDLSNRSFTEEQVSDIVKKTMSACIRGTLKFFETDYIFIRDKKTGEKITGAELGCVAPSGKLNEIVYQYLSDNGIQSLPPARQTKEQKEE